MKTFISNIRTELLKTKNSSAVRLALFAGLMVPVLLFIACIAKPDFSVPLFLLSPWEAFITLAWNSAAPFFLPVYIILLCSLITQIEYRNGTWKQVYASPRSYFDIYFSKFIVIMILVLFSLAVFDFMLIAEGYIINLTINKYKFAGSLPPFWSIIKMTVKIFISILGMSAMQYWMAMRFRNFIVSFGIGFSVMISSFIAHGWDKSHYSPYLYPSQIALGRGGLRDTLTYSVIIFGVVMLLGFADMVYKKEKA